MPFAVQRLADVVLLFFFFRVRRVAEVGTPVVDQPQFKFFHSSVVVDGTERSSVDIVQSLDLCQKQAVAVPGGWSTPHTTCLVVHVQFLGFFCVHDRVVEELQHEDGDVGRFADDEQVVRQSALYVVT